MDEILQHTARSIKMIDPRIEPLARKLLACAWGKRLSLPESWREIAKVAIDALDAQGEPERDEQIVTVPAPPELIRAGERVMQKAMERDEWREAIAGAIADDPNDAMIVTNDILAAIAPLRERLVSRKDVSDWLMREAAAWEREKANGEVALCKIKKETCMALSKMIEVEDLATSKPAPSAAKGGTA